MKPIEFNWRGHRFSFDYVPLIFLALITFALGKADSLTKTNSESLKLIADLNRQRTAAEMRAMNAEKGNASMAGLNVIVISPDGTRQKNIPAKTFADVNQPL